MKIYVSHASNYDYATQLYKPLKKLLAEYELFLPHEGDNVMQKAADILPGCDLLLAEVSHPSTGQGIELGIAHMLKTPIICIYKKDAKPSGSLHYITDQIYEYSDLTEIKQHINQIVQK